MGVSINRGKTPKSSILIGFSLIFTIHFGVPLFLETPKSWMFFTVFYLNSCHEIEADSTQFWGDNPQLGTLGAWCQQPRFEQKNHDIDLDIKLIESLTVDFLTRLLDTRLLCRIMRRFRRSCMVWGVQHLIRQRQKDDSPIGELRGLKSLAERLQQCGGWRLTYLSIWSDFINFFVVSKVAFFWSSVSGFSKQKKSNVFIEAQVRSPRLVLNKLAGLKLLRWCSRGSILRQAPLLPFRATEEFPDASGG